LSLSANYLLAMAGILDVQFIHIRRLNNGFDLAVRLKFHITQSMSEAA
jgi:hypothetical protein